MRKCKQCNKSKKPTEFPKYSTKVQKGRRHTCKACWNKKWSPIVQRHYKKYYHEKATYRKKAIIRARRQYERNKEKHNERERIYNKNHRLQRNVNMQTNRAINAGKLKREPCVVCSEKKTLAHHNDYSKPFEVIWLCRKHHGEIHRLINRQAS